MKLLINESPYQLLPSLAQKIGLNEALFLQQLHFQLQYSQNERSGYFWVFKTIKEWQCEFPFWSYETLKRLIRRLEKLELIVTTNEYNKMKTDKTKWYRIHYANIENLPSFEKENFIAVKQSHRHTQLETRLPYEETKCPFNDEQNELLQENEMSSQHESNLSPTIPIELKSLKNTNVEQVDIVDAVIDFLNEKTNKQFRKSSKSTRSFIHARLRDGYSFEDFQYVIELKAKQWLGDPKMARYLRPDTLFQARKFEAYLNELPARKKQESAPQYKPFVLDFAEED